MGDLLWIVLLILWPIFFVHHIMEWWKGRRPFFDQNNIHERRVVPRIYGVGPMFDRFELEEEEREDIERFNQDWSSHRDNW